MKIKILKSLDHNDIEAQINTFIKNKYIFNININTHHTRLTTRNHAITKTIDLIIYVAIIAHQ